MNEPENLDPTLVSFLSFQEKVLSILSPEQLNEMLVTNNHLIIKELVTSVFRRFYILYQKTHAKYLLYFLS